MPTYKYRAKKGPEEIISGNMDAKSEAEVVERLSQMGYFPVGIELETAASGAQPASIEEKSSGRIKSSEITVMSRQLASLLKSGVPILASLNIIKEQTANPHLKYILNDIHDTVKDGATFSYALSRYPRVFPTLYVSLIRAGEDSGSLPQALIRIAEYRSRHEEMLSRFRMAMAYPVLMALVGIGTIIFMLTFVMPRLMGIFDSMGQGLPLPTKILISLSNALRQYGFWIVVVLFVFILLIKRELRTRQGKLFFSILKLRIPVLGNLTLKSELARFSRTLELLIKSGIPILKAIDISIPVLENEVLKNHFRQSYKELEQGGSFGRSLKNSRVFPSFMSNLLIVGEESGKLDESLSELATSYERDTEEAMRIFASLLEPMMILIMGLAVGFIVVAMLLPIFEINVMVR